MALQGLQTTRCAAASAPETAKKRQRQRKRERGGGWDSSKIARKVSPLNSFMTRTRAQDPSNLGSARVGPCEYIQTKLPRGQ